MNPWRLTLEDWSLCFVASRIAINALDCWAAAFVDKPDVINGVNEIDDDGNEVKDQDENDDEDNDVPHPSIINHYALFHTINAFQEHVALQWIFYENACTCGGTRGVACFAPLCPSRSCFVPWTSSTWLRTGPCTHGVCTRWCTSITTSPRPRGTATPTRHSRTRWSTSWDSVRFTPESARLNTPSRERRRPPSPSSPSRMMARCPLPTILKAPLDGSTARTTPVCKWLVEEVGLDIAGAIQGWIIP